MISHEFAAGVHRQAVSYKRHSSLLSEPSPLLAAAPRRSVVRTRNSRANIGNMKKAKKTKSSGWIRAEYDFTGGIHGKYAHRYAVGSNVVVLDPDCRAVVPDSPLRE